MRDHDASGQGRFAAIRFRALMPVLLMMPLLLMSPGVRGGLLFEDSFETGDLGGGGSGAAIGFQWDPPNRTSIVTMRPQCGGLRPGDATAIFNGRRICNGPVPGRDWQAHDGDNALRFRYPPGVFWAEQRFRLARHLTDFWMRYFVRVPVNFVQGSLNNKFLAIWVDTYDTAGDVTWQTRPDPNGPPGSAVLVYQDGGVTVGETGDTPFIRVPEDRGRWMEIIVHYRSASGPGAADGVIQLYRRWADEAGYQLIHEKRDANTYEPGAAQQGVAQGYFFGWANDPFQQETEWLLDDVQILDELHVPRPVSGLR